MLPFVFSKHLFCQQKMKRRRTPCLHRRWTSESETFVKQDYAESRGLAWFRLVLDFPGTLIAGQQAHPASQGQRLNPDVRHSARPTGDGTTLKESQGLALSALVIGV
jgi:hypothetical protein